MEKEIFVKKFGVDELNVMQGRREEEREISSIWKVKPTLDILNRLIHKIKAHQLFGEITKRRFTHDCRAYNALMSALMRCTDMCGALPQNEQKVFGSKNTNRYADEGCSVRTEKSI